MSRLAALLILLLSLAVSVAVSVLNGDAKCDEMAYEGTVPFVIEVENSETGEKTQTTTYGRSWVCDD